MGGGIAVLFLGSFFVWAFGLLPFYTAITLIRPGIFWLFRGLFSMMFSVVVVFLLWWASIEFRSGWISGIYAIVMVVLSFVSVFVMLFRWIVRRVDQ